MTLTTAPILLTCDACSSICDSCQGSATYCTGCKLKY